MNFFFKIKSSLFGLVQLPFVILWLGLSGCGNYINQKQAPINLDRSAQEKLSADFASVSSAVFEPRCVRCHENYRSYSSVIRDIRAIQSTVASNRMPKDGPLSDSQKEILFLWITKGAPESKEEASPPPAPPALEPTWASLSVGLIGPKCMSCHNSEPNAKAGLDLSTRQAVFNHRNRVFRNGAKLIDFDQPSNSRLYQVVVDETEWMPPIYTDIPPLTEAESLVLRQWIERGLP